MRSTDDGYTWTRPNVTSQTVISVVMDSGYSYVGTVSGARLSTDSGATWNGISSGLPGDQIWSPAASDTILFAATNNDGVFRSTDNGTSWMPATSGIIISEVNSMAGVGPDVYAVINRGSLFSSTDYGTTWSADTGLHSGAISSVTAIGSKVYAVTNTGIFLSSDNGETWAPINAGIMDTTYPGILVESGSNLIAACQDSGRVLLSSDDGATWKDVGQDLPELASLAVSGSYVFAGSYDGMFRSSDNGETWDKISDTLIDLNALVTDGTHIFAGRYQWPNSTLFPPNPPGGMFVSTDNGGTWAPFGGGHLPDHPQVLSLAIHGSDIFAGLIAESYYSGTLYSSTPDGEMFTDVGQGLPYMNVTSLFVNDSDVYVGTWRGGIWARPVSQITAVREPTSPKVPQSFNLEQNYPNPFNPSTTIGYDILERTHVTLVIYDVLGRRIEALVDGVRFPGRYDVIFNASRLSSGVYFYQLRAGSFTETKKLMVIK